jgi:phage terminase small subunit
MANKAGTRPKPTAQKRLEGNPGHRPLPENEWEPDTTSPTKPDEFGRLSDRLWDELVKRLDPVLTSVDGLGLEMICRTYEDWRKYMKDKDEPRADRAYKRIRSMMIEYGLTPASRVKVQPVKSGQKDPLRKFLERGNTGDQPN